MHSATVTAVQLGGKQRGGEGGGGVVSGRGLPCPFLQIEKSALILVKKGSGCLHLWVKCSIQNVVLIVFGVFLFLMTCLRKCPSSSNRKNIL